MTTRIVPPFLSLALLHGLLLATAMAQAPQSAYTITATWSRYNEADSPPSFQLSFSLNEGAVITSPTAPPIVISNNNVDDVALTVVAPNGAEFGEALGSTDSVLGPILDISPGTESHWSGLWTIKEQGAESYTEYQFELPDPSATGLWGTPPEILSPPDGARVGREFTVEVSDGASGVRPPRRPGFGLVALESDGNSTTFALPESSGVALPASFEFRTSKSTNQPLDVSAVPTNVSTLFDATFFLNDYSVPVQVTVTPEPGAMTMALVAMTALASGRAREPKEKRCRPIVRVR